MTRPSEAVTVTWPIRRNEHGLPLLWHAAWIVGDRGEEGALVYFGRGGVSGRHIPPERARALRVRCWPDEDLAAEYVDVFLTGTNEIDAGELSFDRRQPFSRLEELQERFAPRTLEPGGMSFPPPGAR